MKLGLLNYPDKGWKNALPWVGLTVFKRALFKINMRLTHSQPCMKTLEKQELKCGSLDGGEFGGGWIHVLCMAESLCCPPETITTLGIGYTPMQNNQLKKKTKKELKC